MLPAEAMLVNKVDMDLPSWDVTQGRKNKKHLEKSGGGALL